MIRRFDLYDDGRIEESDDGAFVAYEDIEPYIAFEKELPTLIKVYKAHPVSVMLERFQKIHMEADDE